MATACRCVVVLLWGDLALASAATLYLPGTGQVQRELDFESSSLLGRSFDYGAGWAGSGFGLSGTQRGAPEFVAVEPLPRRPAGAGTQGLAFHSGPRDEAWYAAHPEAVGTSVYGSADDESQDDFFMYSASWTPSDTPSVMMHVWLPHSATYTSLRMTTNYANGSGGTSSSFPGMWLRQDRIDFRGPGRRDVSLSMQELFGFGVNVTGGGRWWTLGLSVMPSGDLQYYATPRYVAEFDPTHFLFTNSELSAANGHPVRYLTGNRDAIIMSSNSNASANDETYFDRLIYTNESRAVPALDGDFNFDGVVDAADYTVWRDGYGASFDAGDYSAWSDNYGQQSGYNSALALPEPTGLLLGFTAFLLRGRRAA